MKPFEFPTKCPICGKDNYIGKDDYACSDQNCKFGIGSKAYYKILFDKLYATFYSKMGVPSKYFI